MEEGKAMDCDTPKENPKEAIQKYFVQLTQGCGNTLCDNKYCATATGKKLEPNAAAITGIKLVSAGIRQFCKKPKAQPTQDSQMEDGNKDVEMKPPTQKIKKQAKPVTRSTPKIDRNKQRHFDIAKFKDLVLQSTADGKEDYTLLRRELGTIFSNEEYLSFSFLKNGDANTPVTEEDCGIDFGVLQDFYVDIMKLEKHNVPQVMNSAFGRMIVSPGLAHRLREEELLRSILILIENPSLLDPSYQKQLLSPLCLLIDTLSSSLKETLVRWWSNFSSDHLRQMLAVFQQYITFRILLPPGIYSLHTDEYIPSAARVISYIHKANELARASSRNSLMYGEFYNDLINERIDLQEDFMRWKGIERQGTNEFSFCNLPFILSPASKSKLLHFESRLQQHRRRQQSVRDLLISGNVSELSLRFRINRQHLIRDTLNELSRHDPADLKKELRVHFENEEAVDEGGVQKEFFQLIVREIFDEKYGMFKLYKKTHNFWFNCNSTDFLEFELIGMILGLAIYNGVILDIHFPFIVYKKLRNPDHKATLDDLTDIDPEFASGLRKLLDFEGDVSCFDLDFEVAYDVIGGKAMHELKPNGANIAVTNENRQEYVDLYIEFLLETSVEKQFKRFATGFNTLCMGPGFKLFRAEELELLICGDPILDFEALEKVTVYEGYNKNNTVIKNFWSIVHSLTLEQQKRLLFFATGSDRAPIGGLEKLHFVIMKHGEADRLPQSHTCFNHLLLPPYKTKDKMKESLLAAIENAEGFGML